MTAVVFLRSCWAMAIAGVLAIQMATPARAEKAAERTYEVVVERDVMVPMRDGTRLATDLYIPTENGKPLRNIPAVLLRTPYGKDRWGTSKKNPIVRFFAEHGYLSATQDVRGRFHSEGTYGYHQQEPKDGYDAIEWLARHPLCNGRVGTHGPSAMTSIQLASATQTPPSLVTMIPHNGTINMYRHGTHVGGALRLRRLQWFLERAASSKEVEGRPWASKAIMEMARMPNFTKWAARTPWRRGETLLKLAPTYEDWAIRVCFEHTDYDDYWRDPGSGRDEYFDAYPKIPILWVTGWLDNYPGSIVEGYRRMVEMGRQNQALLVGPWTHNSFTASAGDVNFGNEGGGLASYDDFLHLELRWFDRWLKGIDNSDTGPAVQFFVMGGGDGHKGEGERLNHGGHWEADKMWPPAGASDTDFYLTANGVLSTEPPTVKKSSTTYTHDPSNPVPSAGNPWQFLGVSVPRGPRDQIELPTIPGRGMPGMPISSRPDVLWYQTAPLEKDVTIAGQVHMVLWISSTAPDTDFCVKLLDIHPPSTDYPTGYSMPLSDGTLRARYREGFTSARLMEPGKVYQIEVELEPVANRFCAGHRIGVSVCSSNFPVVEINRNTGDPADRRLICADNTVHHDAARPSHMVLPVWRKDGSK